MKIGNANLKKGITCLLAGLLLLTVAACDSPEEKAKQHYEAGMAFVKKDDYVKAGIEFRNALQLKENYADGWYGLALVEEHDKKWRKYAGDILKAIELDPKHVPAQVRYGKILLLSGKLEDALKASDKASELAPEDPDVLALKAAVLFKLGDRSGAVTAAKAAIAKDPGNVDAVSVLAADRLGDNDPEGAIKVVDVALKHAENNVSLQIIKIQALSKLKKNDEIVRIFQNMIKENPKNTGFRKSLIKFYLQNGDKVKAEETVRNIAKEHPDDIDAKMDVVRFVKTVKGNEAAVAELEHLVAEYPDVFKYRFALADLARIMKDDAKAQTILQSIVADSKATEDVLEAKNQLAQIELAGGHKAEAAKLIGEVLKADPQNTNALVLNGAMLIDEGKIEPAISNLRSSLKSRPESVRTSLLLARAHEINGSLELAEDRFAAAYRYSKYSTQVGLVYAHFFLRHDELKRANDLLEKILEKAPTNTSALKMLANIKLTEQNWAAAEDIAEKIRKIDRSDATADQITGAALAGLRSPGDSENAFEKAYKETPKAGMAMANLVKSYLRNGKIEKAETFLNSVLASGKDNYEAKIFLAQIKFTKGQTKEAEKLLKESITEHPDLSAAYVMLAKYYAGTKQVPAAEKLLEEGLQQAPDDFNMNISLAALYEGQNKIAAAKAIYKNMLKTRPNSEIVANNLASLIAEEPENEEELRRAYSLAKRFRSSKVPFFKDTLGWVHYRLGEYEAAIPLLQDAVLQVPTMPVLRYHLGMAFKADGNADDAMTELETALKLSAKHPFPQKKEAEKALEELKAAAPKVQQD